MSNYINLSDEERERIDGINSARLRRKYDINTLRTIATAYDVASQLSRAAGRDIQTDFKKYLEENGSNLSEVSVYQGMIAHRMREGEFRGLDGRGYRKPNQNKTIDEKIRNMDWNAQDDFR